MKRNTLFFCALCALLFVNTTLRAQEPKREFRATWIATVSNIDWPSSSNRGTTAAKQAKMKAELDAIFDALDDGHINATMLQVRPASDAFYTSTLGEPWSKWLTGTRGTAPGWDPLAYAVEQAHKRGIELHCWINPYRYEVNGSHNTYPATDPIRQDHPDWLLDYNNGSFDGTILDPGNPAVRLYFQQVIADIVSHYDIDGIIFDDYFYPYGGTTTEDSASVALYKPASQSLADWRRSNVDEAVRMVYDTIQSLKPWVRFGIGPFGIWSTSSAAANKYGISLPSGIVGTDAYNLLYCNTIGWMNQGTVDYVSPQLYWSSKSTGQDYDVLCQWWSNMAKHFSDLQTGGKQVHFFPSISASRAVAGTSGAFSANDTVEMATEITDVRNFDQLSAPGVIFYNTTGYKKLAGAIRRSSLPQRALVPAMTWKTAPTLAAPTGLTVSGDTISWQHPSADRFSVYVYPKGTPSQDGLTAAYLRRIVYGKSVVLSDIAGMTVAVCAYDRYGNEFAPATTDTEDPDPSECNQYGWQTKDDMFAAWCADYDTYYGTSNTWLTLSGYKAESDPINSMSVNTYNVGYMYAFMHDAKWSWLGNYINSVTTAANAAGQTYNGSSSVDLLESSESLWRFAVAAFWMDGQRTRWPGSADFTTAGSYSAFRSAWGTTLCPEATAIEDAAEAPAPRFAGRDGYYNLMGLYLGTDAALLPQGFYLRAADGLITKVCIR